MTTDTEFETWVRSQLQEIAEGVTPRPDPYGRLMRRRRFGWLRSGLLAGVTAVAVSGGVIAVVPAGAPEPTPTPTYRFAGELYWRASLVDAPPRGSVAADTAFTNELAARIEEHSRASANPMLVDDRGQPLGEVDARVVFAEDIDDTRVAALALLRTSLPTPYQRYSTARLLWLTGPRGASADELADAHTSPPGRGGYSIAAVSPFPLVSVGGARDVFWTFFGGAPGRVRVALAPPQCTIATAPSEDLDAWTAEPTGSWLVRSAQQHRLEFWRVTCDGVVREEWSVQRPAVTPDDVAAVLTSAGEPYRGQVTSALTQLVNNFGADLVTVPTLVYAGPIPNDNEFGSVSGYAESQRPTLDYDNPQVALLTAPAARGGWIGHLSIDVDPTPDEEVLVQTAFLATSTDPADPGTLFAQKIIDWPHLVFVLSPEGAAMVRIVDEDGIVLDQAAPAGRAALLGLPGPSTWGLRVEALSREGVIATAPITTSTIAFRHHVRDWS